MQDLVFWILKNHKWINFIINALKKKYDNCAELLFTDTDSLIYETETNDVYEYFYENKNLFDFSDYSENSKFFDPVNKKMISKMKNEVKG